MSAGERAAPADRNRARSPDRPSSHLSWGDTPTAGAQAEGAAPGTSPRPCPPPSQRGQEPGDGTAQSRPLRTFLKPWERKRLAPPCKRIIRGPRWRGAGKCPRAVTDVQVGEEMWRPLHPGPLSGCSSWLNA